MALLQRRINFEGFAVVGERQRDLLQRELAGRLVAVLQREHRLVGRVFHAEA